MKKLFLALTGAALMLVANALSDAANKEEMKEYIDAKFKEREVENEEGDCD